MHTILADIAATVRDEQVKSEVRHLRDQSFGITPPPPANGCLFELSQGRQKAIAIARKYGSGGEGEEHKKLKQWLTQHPESLGLTDIVAVDIEHRYLSGDAADLVFFHRNGRYTVIEVETTDPLPGAHQAIKYRALLCAEKDLPLDSSNVQAILVAWSIPKGVESFCNTYGIAVQEQKL